MGAGWSRVATMAVTAYLAILAVNRCLVRVRGGSMEPSLAPGDLLLSVPATPAWIRPGRLVVVDDPAEPGHLLVKRVRVVHDGEVDLRGDATDASTDSRVWGRLPVGRVRRVVVARWPDLRTPLHHRPPAPR